MNKRYPVNLTDTERSQLQELLATGTAPARLLTHARILLKADQGPAGPAWVDERIAEAVETSQPTVSRVRKQYVEQGLTAALHRRSPTRVYQRKLDGTQEARLIALTCGEPPAGQARWTLRLLAEKLVELEIVEGISYQTVRRTLKKNELKPWLKRQWCIPPEANGAFVWRMEDVLDVYRRPDDPRCPLVCMDEVSKQLLRDTRAPVPTAPGQVHRVDHEYERGGVVNCFLGCEPLRGKRWVSVTEQRTKVDWAQQIKTLVDERYPDAERIVLVLDNLNTHSPASLYDAFPPAEAKRLADKLEIHYTPKHGSWLNIAEIELSVLSRQCLDRRVPDLATLRAEVAAWQERRNASGGTIIWRFTTADARIKLRRLYPSVQE
jgi:transposase